MMFEIANPRNVASRMHCGVLEFIAQEGMVYLPYWMMENMRLNEGDIVHLKSASLQKGRFVKLQPQTTDFIKISNPKAVLEQSLRNFSALTKGETFRIQYNKKKYDIGVVEVKPEGGGFAPGAPEAVSIIEADVEVDFEAPADYVEPARVSPLATSPLSTSPLQKSPVLQPMGEPKLDGDSSEDEAEPKSFVGAGFRLDGKPIKVPKSSPGGSSAGGTPGSSSLLGGGGAGVSVGVRIGPGGQIVTAARRSAAAADAGQRPDARRQRADARRRRRRAGHQGAQRAVAGRQRRLLEQVRRRVDAALAPRDVSKIMRCGLYPHPRVARAASCSASASAHRRAARRGRPRAAPRRLPSGPAPAQRRLRCRLRRLGLVVLEHLLLRRRVEGDA